MRNLGFHVPVIMVCHTEGLHTSWKQSVIQGSLILQGIPIFLRKWGPGSPFSWALCMWGPGIPILEGPHPFSHDIVTRLPNLLVASYPHHEQSIKHIFLKRKRQARCCMHMTCYSQFNNLISGLHQLKLFYVNIFFDESLLDEKKRITICCMYT